MAIKRPEHAVSAPAPSMIKASKSTTAARPTWVKMVQGAVKELNEKGGSSIPAIKKFIMANNYTIDKARLTFHMRRAVTTLTGNGTLIQVKGHGLSGSFKLGAKKAPAASVKKGLARMKNTALQGKEPRKMLSMIGAKHIDRAVMHTSNNPEKLEQSKETKQKAAKVAAKKSAPAAKPKAVKKVPSKPVADKKPVAKAEPQKKAPAKPEAEKKTAPKKVPLKAQAEKKAPLKSKVNKPAKAMKSPKPKTIKKVAAKPKVKLAAPK